MHDNLLVALAPTVTCLLERHLRTAKEWFPHQLVPWHVAAELDVNEEWREDRYPLPDAVRRALVVNLLTEDNLPYYFNTIDRFFGADGPWGEWARRWTAEEGRHSIVIRDFLTVTGAVDPVALERGRMQQMTHGFDHPMDGPAECLVYVALQELATRISHRNTGKLLEGPGYEVMARVAADENLHYLFYRDVVSAAIEVDASRMVLAIARQVRDFEMPGTGIEGFGAHARAIARAGIYDLAIHHDQILMPVVLHHWRLEQLEGLNAEAEAAREKLVRRMQRIRHAARVYAERRGEAAALVG